jgi:hypothetical protein
MDSRVDTPGFVSPKN